MTLTKRVYYFSWYKKKNRLILDGIRQLGNTRHFRNFWHAWWASMLFTKWSWRMILPYVAVCGGALRKKYQKKKRGICSRARNWWLPKNFNKLKNPHRILNIYNFWKKRHVFRQTNKLSRVKKKKLTSKICW